MCFSGLRDDGIDYADTTPKHGLTDEEINGDWQAFLEAHQSEFEVVDSDPEDSFDDKLVDVFENISDETIRDLQNFCLAHFDFPVRERADPHTPPEDETITEYSLRIMKHSVRRPSLDSGSQIGVDEEGLEPGGRFGVPKEGYGRIFNWDSEPNLRGAVALDKEWGLSMAHNTLRMFSKLADRLDGCIPNVNTTWSATRSQPPNFVRLVRLLAQQEGEQVIQTYLPLMEKHYQFWRSGADTLSDKPGSVHRRVVRMPNGKIMYRHWDDASGPRDEMYAQDLRTLRDLKRQLGRRPTPAERDRLLGSLRASAESGQDFRLVDTEDAASLCKLRTVELNPIVLNSLMYENAQMIALGYRQKAEEARRIGDRVEATRCTAIFEWYEREAQDISDCIHEYCLTTDGFCADYDFVNGVTLPGNALGAAFALSAGVFSQANGERMLEYIHQKFLKPGGLVNTLLEASTEQWDNNAWPIMQLAAIDGAILYGRFDLALAWTQRWLHCNDLMFAVYRGLLEKSNAQTPGAAGDQGEYEVVPDLLMSIGTDAELRRMLPWLEEMAAAMTREKDETAVGSVAVRS